MAKKKTARKAPAKKPVRKAPAKKPVRKAPAKKPARGGRRPTRKAPPRSQDRSLDLGDDAFEPDHVQLKQGRVLLLRSRRDEAVPVQVPGCFELAGERSLSRGGTLQLKVREDAPEGSYELKAPRRVGHNQDMKGEIVVVSKD